MKSKWKEVLFFFVARLIVVKCDYYFSVVGPSVLRVDEPYKVAVTSHSVYGNELEASVGITGATFSGDNIEFFQTIKVSPGSTNGLKFDVRNAKDETAVIRLMMIF